MSDQWVAGDAGWLFVLYLRYGSLSFTKNPEKYIKYSPDTLELHLKSFFDGGAS